MADEPSRGVKRKRQDNVPTDDDTLAILADLERLAAEAAAESAAKPSKAKVKAEVLKTAAPASYNQESDVGPQLPPHLASAIEDGDAVPPPSSSVPYAADSRAEMPRSQAPSRTTMAQPTPLPLKAKKYLRKGAGEVWEDPTLAEWDDDDYRIFCGDLGNEVTDDVLKNAFHKYPSFLKAKVVRDKRTTKTKGYGFVSFKDVNDYMRAMREMNGKYVGNRPIKMRKSRWSDRNLR